VTVPPLATITVTWRATRSAASTGSRSAWFSAHRYSTRTFCPGQVQPLAEAGEKPGPLGARRNSEKPDHRHRRLRGSLNRPGSRCSQSSKESSPLHLRRSNSDRSRLTSFSPNIWPEIAQAARHFGLLPTSAGRRPSLTGVLTGLRAFSDTSHPYWLAARRPRDEAVSV
jgi:hypothetical protein